MVTGRAPAVSLVADHFSMDQRSELLVSNPRVLVSIRAARPARAGCAEPAMSTVYITISLTSHYMRGSVTPPQLASVA